MAARSTSRQSRFRSLKARTASSANKNWTSGGPANDHDEHDEHADEINTSRTSWPSWLPSARHTGVDRLLPKALQKLAATIALASFCAACSSGAASTPQIVLRTGTPAAVIEVTGLSGRQLDAIVRTPLSEEQWVRLMRVTVKPAGDAPADTPAVAGSYAIVDRAIRFTPLFPLDAGREYGVTFDPSQVPGAGANGSAAIRTAVVSRPAETKAPSTIVDRVYPSADVVPENQLRMYIQFSAPMSHRSGLDYIRLLDDRGKDVVDPFLPLDAEFWNADHTRYTVFFDPGRVKRGILPNQQMGRALEPGRRYTLVVSREWRDAQGVPLKSEFRREFLAGPADERPLATTDWRIEPPSAGSSSPLRVTFPEPLDQGLLMRAVGVSRNGVSLEGDVRVENAETHWTFTPREPWKAGEYQLVVLSFLEDLAGNRIGRAFEVDNFERVDTSAEPERHVVVFRVAER